ACVWIGASNRVLRDVRSISLKGMEVEGKNEAEITRSGVEPPQVFKPTVDKPSQLSSRGLSAYLKNAKRRGVEVSALAVALQRKYSGPFNVVIIALMG